LFAGSAQVQPAVAGPTTAQELEYVNQVPVNVEEHTYLELTDAYDTIDEEPHYHEILDEELEAQTAAVSSCLLCCHF